jgi:hypothetical protein
MLFKYSSGEKAKAGDRIKNHGEPGEVEFLVSEAEILNTLDGREATKVDLAVGRA